VEKTRNGESVRFLRVKSIFPFLFFKNSFSPCGLLPLAIPECILQNGPPRDEDWWEDVSSSDGESENESESKESANRQSELNGESSGGESREKRFRNCGLEAWSQVQRAWRVKIPSTTTKITKATLSKSASIMLKRDLVKGLSGCRQLDLPHRVPLKDLIGAYAEVWNGYTSE
jgi:hypothetical protein